MEDKNISIYMLLFKLLLLIWRKKKKNGMMIGDIKLLINKHVPTRQK